MTAQEILTPSETIIFIKLFFKVQLPIPPSGSGFVQFVSDFKVSRAVLHWNSCQVFLVHCASMVWLKSVKTNRMILKLYDYHLYAKIIKWNSCRPLKWREEATHFNLCFIPSTLSLLQFFSLFVFCSVLCFKLLVHFIPKKLRRIKSRVIISYLLICPPLFFTSFDDCTFNYSVM